MGFQERTDWLSRAPGGCLAVYFDGAFIVEKHKTEHSCLAYRLLIKRADKEPIRDWRTLQNIKNAIAGEEQTALEVYPPEGEVTDTGNLYHLWVLAEGYTIPFVIIPPAGPAVTQS